MEGIYTYFIYQISVYDVTENLVILRSHHFMNWYKLVHVYFIIYISFYIVTIYNFSKWLFLVYLIFSQGGKFFCFSALEQEQKVIFLIVDVDFPYYQGKFYSAHQLFSLIIIYLAVLYDFRLITFI